MNSIVKLGDCMDFMREMPDKAYQLAIVDPPYGLDFSGYKRHSLGVKTRDRFVSNGVKKWDKVAPDDEYFSELRRVSVNQIIWGGNYFDLPPCRGFIFWYKKNPVPNFSDGEYAWTTFDRPAKCFEYRYSGGLEGKTSASVRFHPTQKPVALYTWLLKNYAKEGDKILDTHGGSMSSVIAAIKGGFDITCFELDKDYYEKAKERIENFISQENMFSEKPNITFS